MQRLSRRRFLQITAATFGGAAAATQLKGPLAVAQQSLESGIRTVPTFCDVCFWKCGAIAYVRDGKLWKIEGNPADPLSHGRLCPRGTGGIGAHFDPDRLKAPLVRTGERGAEQWKSVTWDEALQYAADRLLKIKAEHGPESVAMFNHGIGARFVTHALKAYGAINFAAPSFAQCRGPRDVGFALTFGEGIGSPERTDIENAECLVLVGAHLGENMHNSQVQEFARAIDRQASIIVVDPRFSVAAGKAKFYLPIKPGTDLALLLAWMQVIVSESLFHKGFIASHASGFDKFAAAVAQYTPEWASGETGINAETIRATAREMARYRPATLIHPGRRVNWYGDNTQRSRAIALLNALMGNWGRKGGFFVPATMEVPRYPVPAYPKSSKPSIDRPGDKYPFADEGITTAVRDATITGQPYPIKGWVVHGTNLIQALPNQAETIKAIQQLDLLVVVDTVPSEIAGWADVVLPDTTYLERYDELDVESFKEAFVALRQPVVPAPNDQKPGWWIAKQLAEKLKLGDYFPWKDLEEYLAFRVQKGGHDFAALKKTGIIHGPKQPIYVEDGAEITFDTPSKKVEFWSKQLADAGFDPVPPLQGAGTGAARSIPAHHRPRTGSHFFAHAVQSAAARRDEGQRSLAQRKGCGEGRAQERRLGQAQEPGRRRQQPRAAESNRAHSSRVRVYGLRVREQEQGFERRLPQRCERRRAADALPHRSHHGRHQHVRQFRHRGAGLIMARFGMAIDTRKCVGCMDCVLACQTENDVPAGFCRDWITTEVRGEFPNLAMEIRSERCNHCDNPPCVTCCPTGASHVTEPGRVVTVSANRCIGCKACVAACPYGARFVHPEGYTDKCTFCSHRVAKGLLPACASVCPTHCIHFGDLDDPNGALAKLLASRRHHVLLPAAGTRPRIFYLT